jgi:hypothetical protein
LINDIDTAIHQFYANDRIRSIFEMVSGFGVAQTRVLTPSAVSFDVGSGHRVLGDQLAEEEVYVRYYGIYRSDGRGSPNTHSYGFSPWEFVPTVWELIPYSFLVDYFTNIGGILSSWSYRFLVNGWTARTIRRTFKHSNVNLRYYWNESAFPPDQYDHDKSGDPGSASYEVVSFTRNPNAVLEVPSFELQIPGRWTQWVNIVALTGSRDSARRALAR